MAGSRTEPVRQLDCLPEDTPTPAALVGALVHPLRRQILRMLHEAGEARSPHELALALDCDFTDVSYNVKWLADTNVLALTDTITARGSSERFYASAVEDDGGLLLVLIVTRGLD